MVVKARRKITKHEEFRRGVGYTVTGLAAAMEFDHSYVSRVESGELRPSKRYRDTFCNLLGVPAALVFEEKNETSTAS